MNIEISPKEYERKMNWYEAQSYCDLLTIDGKNDWRLPTLDELKEIYNSENDFARNYYWSVDANTPDYSWMLYMANGIQNYNHKKYNYYMRAVRDI